ncbi:hypothetical protein CAL7716_101910 (plasmid) [Calothrix sp. PCC 7716]|nr:hypothetical protein CAL7716_101910 [Calothrix sp. PCC 7716]
MAKKKITKSPEPKVSAKKAKQSEASKNEAPAQEVKAIKPKVEEAPAKKAKQIEVLEGKALVDKVKEMPNSSKEEKAKACGYYIVTKDGQERVSIMKFLNALLDAEEISFDTPSDKSSRGRSASYRIAVQSNGALLIGSAYTKQLGLKPGDEFSLNIGRKHIKLIAIFEQENQDDIAA